jgi:RHS repeat-associated protein
VKDHLGSVLALVNGTGQVAQSQSFDPYGQKLPSVNPSLQPYGFAGMEQDESGLYYARNRYYAPGIGRFISEDPIGFGGGVNFYAYCGGDPVNFIDPMGLFRIGGTDSHPYLWFGAMPGDDTGAYERAYDCKLAADELTDDDITNGMRGATHIGQTGKSRRSKWAHGAIEEVRDQMIGAAVSMATGGMGMLAAETAEGGRWYE